MVGSRISDCSNWFDIWFEDKKAMLEVMLSNMNDDLENGYSYFGKSITEQRRMIDDYNKRFEAEVEKFKEMDEKQVNRWCFYDLKKRGAIT